MIFPFFVVELDMFVPSLLHVGDLGVPPVWLRFQESRESEATPSYRDNSSFNPMGVYPLHFTHLMEYQLLLSLSSPSRYSCYSATVQNRGNQIAYFLYWFH